MVDEPKVKQLVSNELLIMVDTCIDLACRLREDGYKIHVSNDAKKAKATLAAGESTKAVCFSETLRTKLEMLQLILRETTENISDF